MSEKTKEIHVLLPEKLHKATNLYLKRLSREAGRVISITEVVRDFLSLATQKEYKDLWEGDDGNT
jgi:hypothetical protein